MTIKKFRNMDLILLTTIAVILDVILGLFGLFGLWLFMALSIPIILLCYIRWRSYGLIPNIVVVAAHFIIYYLMLKNDIVVVLAHLLAMQTLSFALVMLKWNKLKERYKQFYPIALYFMVCYGIMFMSEWLLMIAFGKSILLLSHLLNHSLNILLGLGLMAIIYRQNDLFVDMETYLKEKDKGN
ncbi:MAG: hypothetical protein IH571_05470 [Acholeplasmataceae bacterium]|nr:hypothetical protein [Acholeplasmataceae bacterium]